MKKVKSIHRAVGTSDGAGVKLNRVFGYHETPKFDPFLMLDYFATNNPDDVRRGFPWHPHRGIETITYILEGSVEHGDSLGNKGVIESGDVQWMTAGSGIVHQEMPDPEVMGMEGFQLWLNLKATNKMTDPKYGDIKSEMIKTFAVDGVSIKVIGGSYEGVTGPIQREDLKVNLLDISVRSKGSFHYKPGPGINTFIFIYKGSGLFGLTGQKAVRKDAILFEGEGEISIEATEDLCFLLGEGLPINEPIAWGGPIVMNTNEELQVAFEEYSNGTFIKK